MNNNKKLTIFTPSYNRAHLLPRLYESLKRQTCKDFVWLIVDDCSTDNTKEYIERLIRENKRVAGEENNGETNHNSDDQCSKGAEYNLVDIIYICREVNGGKMRAHNDGVRACTTKYFLCVDSDDYLVDTAVEDLLAAGAPEPGKSPQAPGFAGIIAHKGSSETELLTGVNFPEGVTESTLYGLYLKGFKGETTIMFKTDVIAQYPFPEIEGEKYVPEDYIYDKIDKSYIYVVLDKIITVCEIVSEGYTDSVVKLKQNNPQAFRLLYEQRAIITPLSVLKIKYSGFYVKYAKKCGRKIFDTGLNPAFVIIGALASVFINE